MSMISRSAGNGISLKSPPPFSLTGIRASSSSEIGIRITDIEHLTVRGFIARGDERGIDYVIDKVEIAPLTSVAIDLDGIAIDEPANADSRETSAAHPSPASLGRRCL